jgi:diguanylate cyclase (GGDEF)-like protein
VNPDETQQLIIDGSAAAGQLRAGFPWLRFEHDLEREFRREYFASRLGQIRFNLWLALLLVVAFGLLYTLVIPLREHFALYAVQFGLVLPLVVGGIVITHLKEGRRLYPRIAPMLAPIGGLAIIAIELKAAQDGVLVVFASLLLTSVCTYFLLGLLFYEAIRTNIILWAAYLAFGIVGGLPESVVIYNSIVLLLANLVGASVAYSVEMGVRQHFLERRMLAETAARDGLTGIYNRRRFDEHLETVWQAAQRDSLALALLLVDIDCFKRFNDHHGHQAGDECLRAVAAALAHSARRPLDFVARYGGEEFAVVLFDPSRPYLHEIANRIHTNVAALGIPHGDSTVAPTVTVSVGIAYVAPTPQRSTQGFVQLADEALYEAKAEGRNRSVFSEAAYDLLETGSFRASRRAAG